MARSAQLVACVLACVAVTAFAQELCPEKSSFNGCKRRGCISVASRRSQEIVCNQCGEGYRLVNQGTSRAKCECAAGYAGKGNDGICKKCPEGTQVAKGGSVISSECLKCPQGTTPSADGTECTCAAGQYLTTFSQVDEGFMPVQCKMCAGRNQYITGNAHTSRSCSTCPNGQVANTAHTWCVDPSDADAVPAPKIPGLDVSLTDIQGALRDARQRAADSRVETADTILQGSSNPLRSLNPVNRLTDSISEIVSGGMDMEELAPPKLPTLQELRSSLNLTDITKAANLTSLQDFAKQLNLTSLNPAELAKLNITSVPELLKALNATAASLPPLDGKAVLEVVGKVGERIMSAMPRLPDPLYVLGLRLDPQALADADLPAVSTVPQLFGSLMSRTIGELDTGDWSDLGRSMGMDD